MSIPTPGDVAPPRGHEALIADALADLDDVADLSLPEALEKLTATSEVLSRVLETSADNVQTAFPGLRQR